MTKKKDGIVSNRSKEQIQRKIILISDQEDEISKYTNDKINIYLQKGDKIYHKKKNGSPIRLNQAENIPQIASGIVQIKEDAPVD